MHAPVVEDPEERQAMAAFGLEDGSFTEVGDSWPGAVWEIASGGRRFSLRRAAKGPRALRFALEANQYLVARKVPLPSLQPSLTGELCTAIGRHTYVLVEWVAGRRLQRSRPEDVGAVAAALARLHLASQGFRASRGAQAYSLVGRWPELWRLKLLDVLRLEDEARGLRADRFAQVFLATAAEFAGLMHWCLEQLGSGFYGRWSEEAESQGSLCHQGFTPERAVERDGAVYPLDLEGWVYDIPARDISRLVCLAVKQEGGQAARDMDQIIMDYARVNPISPAQLDVVYLDLAFPHLYHAAVRDYYYKRHGSRAGTAARLEAAIAIERGWAKGLQERLGAGVEESGWRC